MIYIIIDTEVSYVSDVRGTGLFSKLAHAVNKNMSLPVAENGCGWKD